MLAIFLRNLTNVCLDLKKYIFIQKKERYLLPLIFTSLLLFDQNILYNPIAFMLIIFFCCIILFINFPILVTWTNSKPLYYDDLYLDSQKLPSLSLSDSKKKSYKKLYKLSLTIIDSIMISVISNYWVVKTKGSSSFYEVFGITGGILQIFHVLNLFIGTVLLYSIKHMINNESKIMPILNRMHSDDNIFLKYDNIESCDEELNYTLEDDLREKPTNN